MCCCLFLCWCWTSGQQQPKKISFSFFFSLFFLVFDFFFSFFSLFLSLLFSFFSFFFFLPPWVYYILFFSRFHPDFFPTFSQLFPIASLTSRVHHRYKNPRACRGFLLFSHFIPNFFYLLSIIYYLLSIIYYLLFLSHISFSYLFLISLISYPNKKSEQRSLLFLLFVYTQPGVQPESLLPTS